jgi:hypothetical protein
MRKLGKSTHLVLVFAIVKDTKTYFEFCLKNQFV